MSGNEKTKHLTPLDKIHKINSSYLDFIPVKNFRVIVPVSYEHGHCVVFIINLRLQSYLLKTLLNVDNDKP